MAYRHGIYTEVRAQSGRKAGETTPMEQRFAGAGVYHGVSADREIDSGFVLELAKTVQGMRDTVFDANAADGQYIFFALPVRYGTPTFWVGGLAGGFRKVEAVEMPNESGYTEQYDVWRSINRGLGQKTVTVK